MKMTTKKRVLTDTFQGVRRTIVFFFFNLLNEIIARYMLEEGSDARNQLFLTAISRFVPADQKAERRRRSIADPFLRFSNIRTLNAAFSILSSSIFSLLCHGVDGAKQVPHECTYRIVPKDLRKRISVLLRLKFKALKINNLYISIFARVSSMNDEFIPDENESKHDHIRTPFTFMLL